MDDRGKPVTISVRRTVTVESLTGVNSKDGCGVTADTFRLLASVAHCGRMLLYLRQCGGQNRYSYTMDRHMYISVHAYTPCCSSAILRTTRVRGLRVALLALGGGGGGAPVTVYMNHIVLLFKREDGEPNGIEPRSSSFAA